MKKVVLQNLQSTRGDNFGAICFFYFFPIEWLIASTTTDPVTGEVVAHLFLDATRQPLRADCLAESMEYQEKNKASKSGPYSEKSLVGIINKDEAETSNQLAELRYYDLIVVYFNKNGKVKIIGDETAGMHLLYNQVDEKETTGKTFYELSFSFESEMPARIYPATDEVDLHAIDFATVFA